MAYIDKAVDELIEHGIEGVALWMKRRNFAQAIRHIEYVKTEVDTWRAENTVLETITIGELNINPRWVNALEDDLEIIYVHQLVKLPAYMILDECDNLGESGIEALSKALAERGILWPEPDVDLS